MHSRRWRSHAVTLAVLIIQVGVFSFGTIGMCFDRPHTHGGVPAPDCLMHEQQPAGTTPDTSSHGHHHHVDTTSDNGARVGCSCPSDPLTLLTMEIAVVPNGTAVGLPNLVAHAFSERTQPGPDVRLAPLSPPPRPSLA